MIRSATADDAGAICDIYNHYVANTVVTFEETGVTIDEMRERLDDVLSSHPFLVAEANGSVRGFAYACAWRARSAYRFAVETTIYLAPDSTRRGLGSELYGNLISQLRARRLHTAIGIVALPNDGSSALHERLGYVQVAELKHVGWKFDRWIDVGYWQLML
jgi:phosphinothricin acetyltransferase